MNSSFLKIDSNSCSLSSTKSSHPPLPGKDINKDTSCYKYETIYSEYPEVINL